MGKFVNFLQCCFSKNNSETHYRTVVKADAIQHFPWSLKADVILWGAECIHSKNVLSHQIENSYKALDNI